MTNHRPKFNTDDIALLRRTVVVPFQLSFKGPESLDINNPTHRPIDKTLCQRITEPDCLQQMLTWLVRGAIDWYREGLPTVPDRMSGSLTEYLQENDSLQAFIDEECTKVEGAHVETKVFKAAFETYIGQSVQIQKLAGKMRTKGFRTVRGPHVNGTRPQLYVGLRLAS